MPRYTFEIASTRLTAGQRVETTFQGVQYARDGDYLFVAGPLSVLVSGAQILEAGGTFTSGAPNIDEPVADGDTVITGTAVNNGATVTVSVNAVEAGTGVVAGGVWSVTVPAVAENDEVSAVSLAMEVGATVSTADTVTVTA